MDIVSEIEDAITAIDGHQLTAELIPFGEQPPQVDLDKAFTIVPTGFTTKVSARCIDIRETFDVHIWRVGHSGSMSNAELREKLQPERDQVLVVLAALPHVTSIQGRMEHNPTGDWIKFVFTVVTEYSV